VFGGLLIGLALSGCAEKDTQPADDTAVSAESGGALSDDGAGSSDGGAGGGDGAPNTTGGSDATPPGTGDAPETSADDSPPGGNILLIVVDDIGLDKVAAYGMHPTPAKTPTMDALAAQGVRFTDAYAAPTCSPSRASMLTGRHASRHGVGRWLDPPNDEYDLQESELTLPEMIAYSPLGYATTAVGKWHLVNWATPDPAAHPLRHGFEHHAGSLANPGNALQENEESLGYYNWEKSIDAEVGWSDEYMTVDNTDEALDCISKTPEPWLLYLAYNAAHAPLHAPPDALLDEPLPASPSDLQEFEAIVEGLDTELARLLDGIPADVLADTTIILVGDNGSPDHGISPPLDSARAKGTVYEGGVRVPLIVTGPLVGCEGCESDAMVHVVDIFPTIAEIAGVSLVGLTDDAGEPLSLDGESLLPLFEHPDAPDLRRYLYSEAFHPPGAPPYDYHNRTVRNGDWKLIEIDDGGEVEEALYALVPGDLDEGEDLLAVGLDAEASEAYDRLREELDALSGALAFDR